MTPKERANQMKAADCYQLMRAHFKDDPQKTLTWFQTPNEGLGYSTPLYMIKIGCADKLLKMIKLTINGWVP
jgi:hypothetical protein